MKCERIADVFAAGVARMLVPALVERCGVLLSDDAQTVARDVIRAEFLAMLASEDEAARIIRESHAAGWRQD